MVKLWLASSTKTRLVFSVGRKAKWCLKWKKMRRKNCRRFWLNFLLFLIFEFLNWCFYFFQNPNLIQRVDSSAAKTEATTSSGSAAAKTLGKSASNGNKLFSSSTKSDSSFSSSLNAQKLNPKRVQITPDSTPPKFSSGGAAGDSLERTPTPKSVSNAPSMSSLIDDVPKTPKKPMNRSRSHNKHLIEAGYGIVGVIAVAAIGWFIYRRYTAK